MILLNYIVLKTNEILLCETTTDMENINIYFYIVEKNELKKKNF